MFYFKEFYDKIYTIHMQSSCEYRLLYRFLLLERAHLSEIGGLAFYIMFVAIIAVSVVLHELLHGIGWAVSSGEGWDAVRFITMR